MKNLNMLRVSRKSVFMIAVGLLFVLVAGNAQAVLLGLIPDNTPDLKSRNTIDYYFTNGTNSSGGFTMEVRGLVTSLDDGFSLNNVSGACTFGLGCYTLDAQFTSAGVFSSGTIVVDGTAPSFPPATSGNFVTGVLTAFGWGGDGPSGIFEFAFDIVSGDFNSIWGGVNGGTVIDTRELALGAGMTGSCDDFVSTNCYVGDWDSTSLMTQEFSTAAPPGALLSGLTTSDTFIPVPAAVWLFGSAIGLLGVLRRRSVVAA